MKLRLTAVALASLVLVSCGARTPSQPTTPTLASFTSGTWQLHVDRVWDGHTGAPQFPSDTLDESAYKGVTDGGTYRVEPAEGGRQVTVSNPGAAPCVGRRGTVSISSIQYDFDPPGVFAGARLVVWQTGGGLQGEWTVYGSGVPIVKSERGSIVAAQ